jgi:hypothetical protein
MGGANAVVHNQHVNGPESTLGLGNGQGAALGGAEVGRDVFEANSCKFGRVARHDHYARARRRQQ